MWLRILTTVFFMSFYSIAQSTEIEATLDWAGHIRTGFPVNGVVEGKVVRVGAKVGPGQVLAKLDSKPFNYQIKRCQANIEKLSPAVFDAEQDLIHAEELFERTVLSEVELQKIKGRYESLVAEQLAVKASLQLIQWQKKHASLKALQQSYVLHSNIVSGMVVSDENKADVYIELVSTRQAAVIAWLSTSQKSKLSLGDNMNVIIDGQSIPATLTSLGLQPDKENKYRLEAIFYYEQMVEPGKKIKLKL